MNNLEITQNISGYLDDIYEKSIDVFSSVNISTNKIRIISGICIAMSKELRKASIIATEDNKVKLWIYLEDNMVQAESGHMYLCKTIDEMAKELGFMSVNTVMRDLKEFKAEGVIFSGLYSTVSDTRNNSNLYAYKKQHLTKIVIINDKTYKRADVKHMRTF